MFDVYRDLRRRAFVATVGATARPGNLGPLVDTLAVADEDAMLVMDVSEVMLNDASAVQEFVGALVECGRNHVRVVARRGTARALLRRWGGAGVSVHSSVDEALADRVRAESIGV